MPRFLEKKPEKRDLQSLARHWTKKIAVCHKPKSAIRLAGSVSDRETRLPGILPASVRILFLATPSARREARCMTQAGNLPKV